MPFRDLTLKENGRTPMRRNGGMRILLACGLAASLGGLLCGVSESGDSKTQTARKSGEKGWAYTAPVRPQPPRVKNAAWVRNPIDAFVLARLEAKGLKPSPAADRATLIRRLSFDLTGLPPTPEQVETFVNDPAPDAYERLVDRLLSSPHYGERAALYWLDLVRYAESDGYRADDPRPHAWRYRDYVIRVFNEDRPFDRFILEQLAGDELFPGDPEALVATAFNRNYPDEFNARNLDLRRQEILNDLTDTAGQVLMGLTVGCARCHDHKYDPISQKDYYRLQAFFAAFSPRDNVVLDRPEHMRAYEEQMQVWEEKTAELRRRMDELEQPVRARLMHGDKIKFLPEYQQALDLPPEKRTPYQQQIAEMIGKQVIVKKDVMVKSMKPEVRTEWQEMEKHLAQFDHLKPRPPAVTMTLTDIGPAAPPTFVLKRGNYRQKGEEVSPGFLSILQDSPAAIPAPTDAKTTGRRTVLAKWLTRPDHPLTARVLVNRLWQQHFGRGIVATSSDFGVMGELPTHPELLDWLAREFVERGWSVKAMHRLMVTSAAYRQACLPNPEAVKVDPDNKLLWRMSRRRLEGEALRDAMLAASGQLNLKAGGPSVFPELPAEIDVPKAKWPVTADAAERNRRSVYVFARRNLRYPLFSVYDAPDGNETCARRHVTTTAPQALMLLNSKVVLDVARGYAGRVLRETGGDAKAVVERIYRLGLGRAPDGHEQRLSQEFLLRQTELLRERLARKAPVALPVNAPAGVEPAYGAAVVDLCQVLMNLNEFAYVD
jgi:hypothetical protein